MSVISLDDADAMAAADPQDFLASIERFPAQLSEGWKLGTDVAGIPGGTRFESVAILGMGGSGISGDVCRVVLARDSKAFIHTIRGYDLPGWVGKDTLVFAASYSGETEETLSAYERAVDRGAQVVVVATGGTLAAKAEAAGQPLVRIPSGLQPRAALGYMAAPMLAIAARLGIGAMTEADLEETLHLAESRSQEWGRSTSAASNPTKRLAEALHGRIPIVYGSEGLSEVAAYRWKCQFNETSKVASYWNAISELNHNEVVGWGRLGAVTENFALIVLRHRAENPRIGRRFEVTLPLISEAFGAVEEVATAASSPLAILFDLIYFGDFASTYLALAEGVDPAPVDIITKLKKSLG